MSRHVASYVPVGKGTASRGRRGFRWWSPGRVFGRGVGFVRGGHADVRAETHDAKTEGVRIAPDARVASSETVEPAAVAPRRFPERGPVHLGIRAPDHARHRRVERDDPSTFGVANGLREGDRVPVALAHHAPRRRGHRARGASGATGPTCLPAQPLPAISATRDATSVHT